MRNTRLWIFSVLVYLMACGHPAQAYTAEVSPWALCGAENIAALGTIEQSLSPPNQAIVTAGGR